MNQLTLNIPQIDEEATKLKAEKLLDHNTGYISYRYQMIFCQKLHLLTALFRRALRMNFIHRRDKYLKRIQRAVNRLSQRERQIIVMLYMQPEEMYDYEVYAEMDLSQRSYYRVKAKALYRLAFALREEVYKDGGTSE